jgi:hypothetical protein
MRASHVRAFATGDVSPMVPIAMRQPSNHGAGEQGSNPRAPRTCFRQLLSTYTRAFLTSRGVASVRA